MQRSEAGLWYYWSKLWGRPVNDLKSLLQAPREEGDRPSPWRSQGKEMEVLMKHWTWLLRPPSIYSISLWKGTFKHHTNLVLECGQSGLRSTEGKRLKGPSWHECPAAPLHSTRAKIPIEVTRDEEGNTPGPWYFWASGKANPPGLPAGEGKEKPFEAQLDSASLSEHWES